MEHLIWSCEKPFLVAGTQPSWLLYSTCTCLLGSLQRVSFRNEESKESWTHFDIIGYVVQEMRIGVQVKFCVKICPLGWIWLKQSTFCEYQSDNLMLAKQPFLQGSSLPLYINALPVESNNLMTHNGATPPRSSSISPYSGTKWKAYDWKNQAKRQITRVLAMTFKMLHTLSKISPTHSSLGKHERKKHFCYHQDPRWTI